MEGMRSVSFALMIAPIATVVLAVVMVMSDSRERLKRIPWEWAMVSVPLASLYSVLVFELYLPSLFRLALSVFGDSPNTPLLLRVMLRSGMVMAVGMLVLVGAGIFGLAHQSIEQPTKSEPAAWRVLRGFGACTALGGAIASIAQGAAAGPSVILRVTMIIGVLAFAGGQIGICIRRQIDIATVLAQCFEKVKSANPSDRERAVWRMAEYGMGSQAVYDQLVASLSDEHRGVRLRAAQALGIFWGSKALSAVPGLIPLLVDRSLETGIASESREALKRITGQDFKYDVEQWQRWWDEHASDVLGAPGTDESSSSG